MTISTIKKTLRAYTGSELVTKKQLAKYLNKSDNCHLIREVIRGVPRIGNGFPVEDLAPRIYEMQKIK